MLRTAVATLLTGVCHRSSDASESHRNTFLVNPRGGRPSDYSHARTFSLAKVCEVEHNLGSRRRRKSAGATDDGEPADRRRPSRIYEVGSEPDPRFTMANERTLLAWLRTALAFVVTGIAATALQDHVARPAFIGIVAGGACLTGTIAAIAAYGRWQRIELSLRLQRPLPDPRVAGLLVVALVVLAAAGVVTLVWDAL